MHSEWRRKRRAWGYDAVRAIEEDDPARVIRAFKHPTELSVVDLNTQVEMDYGGYTWTEWMHTYYGDTALHLALKWRRHRAVKALLSMNPDWTIRNEAGIAAEDLMIRLYGKDALALKTEQEIEYENAAMWAEEAAMRSLISAEIDAREKARRDFFDHLHALRTRGVDTEAASLLACGRVLAKEARRDRARAVEPYGKTTHRWAQHICRELRRNRLAAQRGTMRRNDLPARASSPARNTPSPLRDRSAPSPVSPGTEARKRGLKTIRDRGNDSGSDINHVSATSIFDGAIAGKRSRQTPSVSSPRRSPKGLQQQRPRTATSRASPTRPSEEEAAAAEAAAATSPGALSSLGSRSAWRHGPAGSPQRFDRASRTAVARKTRILAAGKSVQRISAAARLKGKMERLCTSKPGSTSTALAPATSPRQLSPRTAATGSRMPPSRLVLSSTSHPSACGGSGVGGTDGEKTTGAAVEGCLGLPTNNVGDANSLEGTEELYTSSDAYGRRQEAEDAQKYRSLKGRQAPDAESLEHERSDGKGEALGGPQPIGAACSVPSAGARNGAELGLDNRGTDRVPPHEDKRDKTPERSRRGPRETVAPSARTEDVFSSTPTDSEVVPAPRPPISPPRRTYLYMPDTPPGLRLLTPTTRGAERAPREQAALGAVEDATEVLTMATVIAGDGSRVPAFHVPRICAQHELKYSAPLSTCQAAALAAVIVARPGVLLRLNLAGKRIGDSGVTQLAPAVPHVRSVDLRACNIGDPGVMALADALKAASAGESAAPDRRNRESRLESLCLAGNRLMDEGAEVLGIALESVRRSATGLRWLSVAGNSRLSESAKASLVRAGTRAGPNALTLIV